MAANNFIRSIIIYRLQSKLSHSYSHKIIAQVSFIGSLIHYISYSFRTPLSKFHSTFYQATEFQLVSSFSIYSYKSGSLAINLNALQKSVRLLQGSLRAFISFFVNMLGICAFSCTKSNVSGQDISQEWINLWQLIHTNTHSFRLSMLS